MKNNHHNLFSASGCLTSEAFELLRKGLLSVDEQKLLKEHIAGCPLCSIAYEGLVEVDLTKLNSDLEEVKRNLQVVRPLDFMPEKRGLKHKIRIRIITLLTIVALLSIPFFFIERGIKPTPTIIEEDAIAPFRLERKDTLPARLEKKEQSSYESSKEQGTK